MSNLPIKVVPGKKSVYIWADGKGTDSDPFKIKISDPLKRREREVSLTATPWAIANADTNLYGWTIINPNTVPVYVKVYATNNPTVGTTTPSFLIPVPAGNATQPGFSIREPERIYQFCDGGLAIAVVTGLADSDNTAPASDVYCELVVDL